MTLDIVERQVLIDFFKDANGFRWHHRVLLLATPALGVWIAMAPDFAVQRLDLDDHRVVALGRATAFPQDRNHKTYHFDNPINPEDLRAGRADAPALLAVLGVVAPAAQAAAGSN